MKKPSFPVPPPPFEPIHARAYHLWQEANQPTGQDMHFWLQAEQQALTQVQAAQQAQAQPHAGKATTSSKTRANARPSPTTAKSAPPQALTFKPTPKTGSKRSTKPPAR
jgi:hypothetical protein